jgi:hypothetical protein
MNGIEGRGHRRLVIGTRLVREPDDERREVRMVKVVEGGPEYRGERFSLLSAY